MNRIAHLMESFGAVAAEPPSTIEEAQYQNASSGCTSLFSPLHYERNYAYPLIVWLHGPGDDERQLKRIMPLVSMRNYVAVGPRGTQPADECDDRAFGWSQSEDHIQLAEHRVFDAIDAAFEKFNVDATRVFLAGFASGGTMALRVALDHPEKFAGVLSLGGPFPSGQAPLKRLAEVRRLRLLLATGRDSLRYPPAGVCQDLRLLYAAGMSVCLRQYPCGDELTTLMLSDMDRWIMDQLLSATTVGADRERAPRT